MSAASVQLELDEGTIGPVFGVKDCNLRALERATGARISARGGTVAVAGDDDSVELAKSLLEQASQLVRDGVGFKPGDFEVAARLVAETPDLSLRKLLVEEAVAASDRRRVLPRSPAQQAYLHSIRSNDIVFGIGPAGTGKTYLAVALGLEALKARSVRRIVLTRPAVEAGESLGFLPGDLVEKVNPYLRPLHDAIHDLADSEIARSFLERGDIEVAPLAFMRGRTLSNSFIILDEAQNTTTDQMKMFLTRMGLSSRMVITGDTTQVDLPKGRRSGLSHAAELLSDVDGIGIVRFSERDVVRHRLVRDIIRAYDRNDSAADRDASGDDVRRDDAPSPEEGKGS